MVQNARGNWRWSLSIDAIRQLMEIYRWDTSVIDETNPRFIDAEQMLGDLSLSANKADTPQNRNGGEIYRDKLTIRGKRQRIELTVVPPLKRGGLPSLVRVRLKGNGK